MTASLRLKKLHWPTLRLLIRPARCSVARCTETLDWDRPQRSNLPAHTPSSSGWSWSAKCFSGSFSHCRISRRTGWARALMISSRSMESDMAADCAYRIEANCISGFPDTQIVCSDSDYRRC